MEYASMAEKILRQIETIIKNDPDLEDFAIVPTDDNISNKSPVLYEQHHLGLHSWCTKYVYQYVCGELMKARKALAQRRLRYDVEQDLNRLLIGALLINPDVTTFWNMRRELVEQDIFTVKQELLFSKLVLTRKHKSYEAFAYRRWLISRLLDPRRDVANDFFVNELELCTLTSNKTHHNYHAWTHRQWCLSKSVHFQPDLILTEDEHSQASLWFHVSDNCVYHYKVFLLDEMRRHKMFDETHLHKSIVIDVTDWMKTIIRTDVSEFLPLLLGDRIQSLGVKEFTNYVNYLQSLLLTIDITNSLAYMNHESRWLLRRACLYRIVEVAHEILQEDFDRNLCRNLNDKYGKRVRLSGDNLVNVVTNDKEKEPKNVFDGGRTGGQFRSTYLYKFLCQTEKTHIERCEERDSLKRLYAKRHEKWVTYILGLNVT